ncbi:MAG: UDP-3-O-(3-hydroxymyristoyl)glucosamine N-acyltransferase [Candidatus Omnitrophica bacterium]|nr:UDP-3-O-(3-hydroxymyristoyl)glucosamine N-acyltransferase [Candidatus Omnitrophota bacterium]MCA9424200.1 UDP-3-O-(3-hydroxymyristoyl)glucosamine N-acyltransferase [Candidatus Omnitrophota bacterium]MCA9435160.1 UDP-3-O-(3-hydroxymyristoyl)glucosamine N-acyltransferase [Candidatus Omnitrophota bacterium]MCA9446376.1 UDP-3-O-(3-hydroxymyristoyl)glucosamine N-acyltransferase [Candidatus Omnitrophota bacterium]MCB9768921.1 UDP-3-O-(3-hydroxymyristoyl)glucosamine N-acyltransferase [Candidatus Om
MDELAKRISCEVQGDPSVIIEGVNTLDAAKPGELSFVHNEKYISQIKDCKASAIVVPYDLETDFRPLLRSRDPYVTFGEAMRIFLPRRQRPMPGIHPSAVVAESAQVDPEASVGPYCFIGEGSVIQGAATLMAGTQVGDGCWIGPSVWIFPQVVVGARTRVGEETVIHPGTVLGSGLDPDKEISEDAPKYCVEVGRDVEIGANVTVEAGSKNPTRIGPGTKIDNLVRIGSGARIGDDCIIVAQVSIGAGAVIGNNVTLAGQVGIEPNRQIGDEVMVGAKSLVEDEVEDRAVVSGIPAIRHDLDLRLKAHLRRLPKLFQRLESLERQLGEVASGEK